MCDCLPEPQAVTLALPRKRHHSPTVGVDRLKPFSVCVMKDTELEKL